jgi:hypothetical protein
MRRRTTEPAGGADIEQPKKRVASNGNKLPDPIREGEILTDITKNQWKLGRSIGVGGFGEIYLGKLALRTNTFTDEAVILWLLKCEWLIGSGGILVAV